MKKSLLLTGMKHCGKSTLGKMLSKELSLPFTDIDLILENIYFKETGEKSDSRGIYRKGRSLFQEYEYKASQECVSTAAESSIICAAGGGICDNPKAVEILGKSFYIIYIYEEAEILYNRIIKKGIPAFLSGNNPFDEFKHLFETRTSIYDKISDMKIISKRRSATEICSEIIKQLEETDYAW